MAIRVTVTSPDIPDGNFVDATGWHVDDEGHLHITKSGGGNVATYHATAWATVERALEDAK